MYIDSPLQAEVIIVSNQQTENPIKVGMWEMWKATFLLIYFSQNVWVAENMLGKIDMNKCNCGGNIHLCPGVGEVTYPLGYYDNCDG